jgi:hypothetical protein
MTRGSRRLMLSSRFQDGGEVLDVMKTMSQMIGVCSRIEKRGENTWGLVLGGVLWASSFWFLGRSDLYWSCLAMANLYLSPCWSHCLEFIQVSLGWKPIICWLDDDSVCVCTISFLETLFLESLFCSLGVAIGGDSSCYFAHQFSGFFSFLLAVCILDIFLNIMLLQRLDVIDIYLVFIYFLYNFFEGKHSYIHCASQKKKLCPLWMRMRRE